MREEGRLRAVCAMRRRQYDTPRNGSLWQKQNCGSQSARLARRCPSLVLARIPSAFAIAFGKPRRGLGRRLQSGRRVIQTLRSRATDRLALCWGAFCVRGIITAGTFRAMPSSSSNFLAQQIQTHCDVSSFPATASGSAPFAWPRNR